MSEWTYVWAAYGLTWITLTVYAIHLRRRADRATRAWASTTGTRSGEER